MATVKLDGYLEKLKESVFKNNFETENAKLSSAIALMNAREVAGLTQRELADLASLPQSTVARIE